MTANGICCCVSYKRTELFDAIANIIRYGKSMAGFPDWGSSSNSNGQQRTAIVNWSGDGMTMIGLFSIKIRFRITIKRNESAKMTEMAPTVWLNNGWKCMSCASVCFRLFCQLSHLIRSLMWSHRIHPPERFYFENKKPEPINRIRWFGISIEHLHHFTVWREGQSPVECLQRIIVE